MKMRSSHTSRIVCWVRQAAGHLNHMMLGRIGIIISYRFSVVPICWWLVNQILVALSSQPHFVAGWEVDDMGTSSIRTLSDCSNCRSNRACSNTSESVSPKTIYCVHTRHKCEFHPLDCDSHVSKLQARSQPNSTLWFSGIVLIVYGKYRKPVSSSRESFRKGR